MQQISLILVSLSISTIQLYVHKQHFARNIPTDGFKYVFISVLVHDDYVHVFVLTIEYFTREERYVWKIGVDRATSWVLSCELLFFFE